MKKAMFEKSFIKICSTFVLVMLCLMICSENLKAETVDKILAKVGSEVITTRDVAQKIAERRSYFMNKYGPQKGVVEFTKYKQDALNEMILEIVLNEQIKKEAIAVSDEELQTEYKSRLSQNRITEQMLLQKLAKEGLSLKEFKDQIRQDMEKQRFVQKKIMPAVNVSDYELQNEYEKNKSQFQVYSKLSFIEVFLTQDKFSNVDEMVGVAKQIQSSLKRGQSVAAQIQKYSSGAFAAKGGDSGLVDAANLRPEIQAILSRLKTGETSDPISVGAGVFIFKLVSKAEPKPLPFNEVVGQLRQMLGEKLLEEKTRNFLMAARDQMYVEILK